ncbi:MAG: hypothetical protein ACR2IL_11755 [Chitinophagaceae bacterium]
MKKIRFGVLLLLVACLWSACSITKPCGCGNNLNYYKPKKFNK